jgi:ABC-type lipoprotein release transport system permease subunit
LFYTGASTRILAVDPVPFNPDKPFMYQPLVLFVGLRFVRARKKNQLMSFVSLISMLGVALGVLVMIAVLSVINASTSVMREEMLKSIPHASLRVPMAFHEDGRLDAEWLSTVLAVEGVAGAAPYRQGEAWLQYRSAADFVQVRGIDPSLEASLKTDAPLRLARVLRALETVPEGIVPGSSLAGRLGLFPDQRLDLTALDALTSQQGDRTRSFRVLGVTDLGFYGNRDTALISLAAAGELFTGDQAAVELRLQLRMDEPKRIIEVEWGEKARTQYPVDIEIQAWDRSGLLRDVTGVLSSDKVNVLSVNTLTDTEDGIARMSITLEVDGLETLGRLFSRIQQLSNVIEVRRLRGSGQPGKSTRRKGKHS